MILADTAIRLEKSEPSPIEPHSRFPQRLGHSLEDLAERAMSTEVMLADDAKADGLPRVLCARFVQTDEHHSTHLLEYALGVIGDGTAKPILRSQTIFPL